jgi:uncharacterized protein
MITAAAIGLIVGALLGMVGGGGSIMAVPALVYVVGMPISEAITSALVVVGASSAAAVIPRLKRDVVWWLALTVGATGALASFAGTALGRSLDAHSLMLAFSAIMIVAGIKMLLPTTSPALRKNTSATVLSRPARIGRALLTGGVVGFLTGLLGVGGGFLIVPALVLVLGLPMSVAAGTSLVIILLNSAGALVSHLQDLHLDWGLTAAFGIAAMVASFAGSRIAPILPESALRRGFAGLVVAAAVFTAGSGIISATS